MPRNSSGVYTLPAGNPVVSNTTILSAWANSTMPDIAQALSDSLTRNGAAKVTGNQDMGGFRHLNVGVAAAYTEYPRTDQVQNGGLIRCTGESNVADAYSANLPFGLNLFSNGMMIVIKFPVTNVGTTPTLNINSTVALPILREDGSVIVAGDCRATVPSRLMYNNTAWLLLGAVVAASSVAGVQTFNTRAGNVVLTSADVTSALTYTPLNRAGGTMTGPLVLAADAAASLQAVTLQQLLAQIAAIPSGGVSSWNGRAGAVTMTGTDVVNALTYTPVNKVGDTMTGNLTLPQLIPNQIKGSAVQAAGGVSIGAVAVNWNDGMTQSIQMTGAITISFTNFNTYAPLLRLYLLNTSAGAVTWPAGVNWPGGTPPVLTTGPLKQAIIAFLSWGGNPILANAAVY